MASIYGPYVRFHLLPLRGSEELYASGYHDQALDVWAARVAAWARGEEPCDAEKIIPDRRPKMPRRNVYLYFDNDAKVRAPRDALGLIERVRKLLKQDRIGLGAALATK